MEEDQGLTCLYKNGESKNFLGAEVEEAEKEGWKDTPQPVEQAAAASGATTLKNKLDPKRP